MTTGPSVAVVICAYTEQRWNDLLAAYGSLLEQSVPPQEIVVVIDHNERLLGRLRAEVPSARIVPNTGSAGLSGARNTGMAETSSEIVLFLDDDATASQYWVEFMTRPFLQSDIQGVGGRALPSWDEPGRPAWFPEPFLWIVGCSYEGQPALQADIRNPLGCAMGFRRSALARTGGFSETVGRVGTHPVGCEETDLSIRLLQILPKARIVLVTDAVVHHRVPSSRLSIAYFVRRCYWEGVSKAGVAARVGSRDALASERGYASRILPRSFWRGLVEFSHGDVTGVERSAAIASGLAVTILGYLGGRVKQRYCALKGTREPWVPLTIATGSRRSPTTRRPDAA